MSSSPDGDPTVPQARIIKDGDTKTKFADVAGCDGAKTELMEAPMILDGEMESFRDEQNNTWPGMGYEKL